MAKFVGLILGYLVGRLPGALIGFLIGLFIDNFSRIEVKRTSGPAQDYFVLGPSDFAKTLLMLSAAVMKADGRVMRSELDYARTFFTRQFGEVYTGQLLVMLRDILQQQIPISMVCNQIRQQMRYEVRLQLVHYLFGLAAADGSVSAQELRVIQDIARLIGLNQPDVESIKAMFHADPDSDYRILEISPDASDEDVKRAFRTMAKKYHPDKLTQMGEEFQKSGQEKFRNVQEAYTRIRKKRGMT